MFVKLVFALSFLTVASLARAEEEELDPFAPGVEQTLQEFDRAYEAQTGLSSHPAGRADSLLNGVGTCYREGCPIYAEVDKASQTLRLYQGGRLYDQWLVSSGKAGHSTPSLDVHPDGRIYEAYNSTKFPGGDYMGLGNMPYAVFLRGGVAIHGTPESNWPFLGRPASHGCIRLHPDNARFFNRLVRQVGVANTWVWVH